MSEPTVSVRFQIECIAEELYPLFSYEGVEVLQNKDHYCVISKLTRENDRLPILILSKKDLSIVEVLYDLTNEDYLKDYKKFREPRHNWGKPGIVNFYDDIKK